GRKRAAQPARGSGGRSRAPGADPGARERRRIRPLADGARTRGGARRGASGGAPPARRHAARRAAAQRIRDARDSRRPRPRARRDRRRGVRPARARTRRSGSARSTLASMKPFGQHPDDKEPPKAVTALLEQVVKDGGHVLAVYREPVGGHWQAFCLLPLDAVAPTPYQRDLSPTHAKRLTEVVKKIDRFVDPVVVVSPRPGVYWTPNGHHRRTALEKLKADWVPAILVPEPEVAFQILALNTEKAHNLKEKSLEVIRMYRGL